MTGKIFRSTLAASLTVLLASLLVITGCLYTYFGTVREQQLQTELTLAAAAVEADGADYLVRVRDTAERLTWVASDGTVLYDTRADTQPMENHGQREEIREARLDLEHPLDNNAYEELSPLLGRVYAQQQEIRHRTRDLRQQQDEFEQITGSMREGLVLLDHSGRILSINPAAQALFHADGTCVGQDFLTVDRHPDLTAAIHDAAETGHSQLRAERRGREYQLDFSRIESNGKVLGTVLLAFDVTEQAEAERMRREFTANVSHELKTPLQSIIGSAELLENGLVKPEDQPRFLNRIHQEADRLVALINDILRLSQLDEGGALPHEQVSVLELAQEAARSLTAQAAAQAVHISVTGTAGTVFGVRRLLYEIARNLCENAVKYNVPGGSVTVEVAETDRDVALLVRDTGIGIPEGDQSRVFERFYRVDKSHSRAIGGTGLGLSIVKHAVAYHHGTLRLESQPGKGTVITVTLPKKPTE